LSDLLGGLVGWRSTDRLEVTRLLGHLPGVIERAVWDALSVRDEKAPAILDAKGHVQADPEMRDSEIVPLHTPVDHYEQDPIPRLSSAPYRAAVDAYMSAEVLPFVPDAWVDHLKTKIGCEVALTRQFYRYVAPRSLAEIDAEIRALEGEIQRLLQEVTTQ
jgi:type I restriction enzyme M protein